MMINNNMIDGSPPIPIIDLEGNNGNSNSNSGNHISNEAAVVDEIRNACQNYGFFFIKNHGIANLQEVFNQSKLFFEQPVEEKMKCLCNEGNLGYTKYQDEILSPDKQSCGDTKEGYYIGRPPEEDEVDSNLYENVWPEGQHSFHWKQVMTQYHIDCMCLGRRLLCLISLALGLDRNFFDPVMRRPTALLRLLHYGTTESDTTAGVYGCGPHSDYGMITLLTTNGVSGLEICLHDEWIPIPPLPGMFIVNIGDCLQRITNDYFKSTVHRVVVGSHTGEDRYSMAFFYEPNRQAEVECLPLFSGEAEDKQKTAGVKYPTILYGDYLKQKYEITSTSAYYNT
jgi:isopenicillin N synthase-like dioxygenase